MNILLRSSVTLGLMILTFLAVVRPLAHAYNGVIPTVEVVNKDYTAITDLSVAKMSETGALSGSGASATINPDNDPDRFYIRLIGGGLIGSAQTLKVGTVQNPDSSYDDDATIIGTHASGADLITNSLLLVSDDIDDDVVIDSTGDDAPHDRTHKVQLGGKFEIKSVTIGGDEILLEQRYPVPPRETIKFHVMIEKDPTSSTTLIGERFEDTNNNGTRDSGEAYDDINNNNTWDLFLSEADARSRVETEIKVLKERYAQVGVKCNVNVEVVDVPLLLTTGSHLGTSLAYNYDELSLLDKALFEAELYSQDNANDIEVYYVGKFKYSGESGWVRGTSYSSSSHRDISTHDINDSVFISNKASLYTLGHEIWHLILLGADHDASQYNLFHHTTERARMQDATQGDTKRLNNTQETAIKASAYTP